MGRITTRTAITRVRLGEEPARRVDTLAVEEPLEIRIGGRPFVVTMRTPGHDVELAAGFLLSEGVLRGPGDLAAAIHCGGPGTGTRSPAPLVARPADAEAPVNTLNVLDVSLAPGVPEPSADAARSVYTTSSCGICGTASIEAVATVARVDLREDPTTTTPQRLAEQPDALRARQAAFDRTGGLHAAGLFDAATGELLVVREDVGRHNAVDKVVGWALMQDRWPLRGTVLQVSGRASFELVQKAAVAGVPIMAAVSAPSSLAVELARERDLCLVGFLRGASMNVYSAPHRVQGLS